MSTFSTDWLALREPADRLARDRTACRLRRPDEGRDVAVEVVDLGAGTGANLRFTAPVLGGPQHWRLVDGDAGVLRAMPDVMRDWASRHDARVRTGRRGLELVGSGFCCTAERVEADLAVRPDALPLPARGVVTASALLDLVSAEWLDTLARRCAEAGARVLFALTYDGRIGLQPPDPDDERVRALVNRHQRRDKGFGPALGPAAAAAAHERFAAQGYALRLRRSDWRLGPEAAALQRALVTGWLDAAIATAPSARGGLEAWHARRLAWIDEGGSSIAVGHVDLSGAPVGLETADRRPQ